MLKLRIKCFFYIRFASSLPKHNTVLALFLLSVYSNKSSIKKCCLGMNGVGLCCDVFGLAGSRSCALRRPHDMKQFAFVFFFIFFSNASDNNKTFDTRERQGMISGFLLRIRFNDYNMFDSLNKGFKVRLIPAMELRTLSFVLDDFIVILQHDINNCLPCNCPRNDSILFVYWWKRHTKSTSMFSFPPPRWPQRSRCVFGVLLTRGWF